MLKVKTLVKMKTLVNGRKLMTSLEGLFIGISKKIIKCDDRVYLCCKEIN